MSAQLEDGYTRIANEILEKIITYDLSGQELRLIIFIFRKTYGFSKCEDFLSLSQMMEATGLSKTRCSQVINKLQLRNSVTVTENRNGLVKKYKFNKDFATWVGVTENCNRYGKTQSTVTLFRNPPLRKTVTTKETITKESITKENIALAVNNYSEDFLKFYNLYPLKKEKAGAYKAWCKLNGKRPSTEIILTAIQNQIDWRNNPNNNDFIPPWKHPATWLNKGCWEDEVKFGATSMSFNGDLTQQS
jgi:phage replication O-like protein O